MSIAGGWAITTEAKNYPNCDLPEPVASAFSQATMYLEGARYEPLMYLATQVVNGTNHMILCRQTVVSVKSIVKIVKMVLNIPAVGDPQIVTFDPLF